MNPVRTLVAALVATAALFAVPSAWAADNNPTPGEPPAPTCSPAGGGGLPRCKTPTPPPPTPPLPPAPSAGARQIDLGLVRSLAEGALVDALSQASLPGSVTTGSKPSGWIDLGNHRSGRWYVEPDYWPLQYCVERCTQAPSMAKLGDWYALYRVRGRFQLQIFQGVPTIGFQNGLPSINWPGVRVEVTTLTVTKPFTLRAGCVGWQSGAGRLQAVFLRSGLTFERPVSWVEHAANLVVRAVTSGDLTNRINQYIANALTAATGSPQEQQLVDITRYVASDSTGQPMSCRSLGVRRGETRWGDGVLYDPAPMLPSGPLTPPVR